MPDRPVNFVLQNNGDLWEYISGNWRYLSPNIASISDQSIDNQGHAMIDAVEPNGNAWEYHDQVGWTYLSNNAASAKSGQGVSYVLFNNGTVYQYDDASTNWTFLDSGAVQIDAGTDRYGVNTVGAVYSSANFWEYSDTSGWHFIDSSVQSISVGQQGIATYVTTAQNAYLYSEVSGVSSFLGSGVAQSVTGVDQFGNYMIDLVYSNGDNWEYRVGKGWFYLDFNVRSISKAVGGISIHVSNANNAWLFDNWGNYVLLATNTFTAA
jgi:hypothetical protein